MKRDVVCEQACDASGGTGQTSGLSTQFLQESARRLGVAALVFAIGPLIPFLASFPFYELDGASPPSVLLCARLSMVALMVMSWGMFALTRLVACPRMVMNLGLLYEELGALVICFPNYYTNEFLQADMSRLTWLPIWLLLFPLVVPARPLKNLAFALGSATMPLLVFGAWTLRTGTPLPEVQVLLATFAPNYVVALVAILPAWMLYRVGSSASAAAAKARELGSYQLVRLIGSGGMGEVWAAEHRMLARPAAIKLIKAEFLAAENPHERETIVARFEREARATAQLRSSHTIGLYDFGVTSEGTFYYVMELLQGIDLETLIQRAGPLPAGRVIHILREACESLAEAHAAGMIHRDIKPANVFVCKLGVRYDHVKLLDFGLVSLGRRQQAKQDVKLTGEGFVVGTPAFMAPEQAEGKDEVDARADLYSLGCVAYWLLSGRLVFEQDTPVRMIVDHLKTPPELPSRKSGRFIPADLEEVIMACLAKDPADRPAGALELAQRLEVLQESHPWRQEDARAWWSAEASDVVPPPALGDEVAPSRAVTRLLPATP